MTQYEITVEAAAVRDRFNNINLHDCRVLGLEVGRRIGDGTDAIRLRLEIISGARADEWLPAYLAFLDCAGLATQIDLWGKRVCGDAIVDSTCEPLSGEIVGMLDQNVRRQVEQPFTSLLVFTVTLCPPGGDLRVVARNFVLQLDHDPVS